MGSEAVSDAGPLIHLSQIDELKSLQIVDRLLVPSEVEEGFGKGDSPKRLDDLDMIDVNHLKGKGANSAGALSREYGLDLGEAEAIVLAKKEDISLIFTGDLGARRTATMRGLEPHGSVGILLRAYRDGIIEENEALTAIRDLHTESTLYLTSDLTNKAIEAVNRYSKGEE